jgi:hypothetical protein
MPRSEAECTAGNAKKPMDIVDIVLRLDMTLRRSAAAHSAE